MNGPSKGVMAVLCLVLLVLIGLRFLAEPFIRRWQDRFPPT